MRKLFAGTMLTFLLGALAIGGALAWTGSTIGSSTAQAGQVAITFGAYNQTGAKVVPNNTWTTVANGNITNTGDIAVQVNGGSVTNINAGACSDDMAGQVVPTDGSFVAPSATGGGYAVQLYMSSGAEDSCQNATIYYDVTISVNS